MFVDSKDVSKVYEDLNPVVTGKKTLVLPLNYSLESNEIVESLSEEIKKTSKRRVSPNVFIRRH